ncbi:MAG TPA: T9SS type A sorting domain-containing protein [Bacteroidota bacterium]|nr:T9SS type A sorting domain-containing protein [Bacteroidota bacterium]
MERSAYIPHLSCCFLLLLLPCGASGQFFDQHPGALGTGAVGYSGQGYGVALSADGNTLLLSGPFDSGGIGAAWAFVRDGDMWRQQGKLVGTDAAVPFWWEIPGQPVDLSSDGNTAIVGGSTAGGGVAAAWIFTRTGDTWSQQGDKLTGTGAADADTIHWWAKGVSVAISGDGNTAVMGVPFDNREVGAAWIFVRSGITWTQQGGKLTAPNPGAHPGQGASVDISGDGNTVVIGAPRSNFDVGGAWVFTRTAGLWTQQGGKIVDAFPYVFNQGTSVAIANDGNTVLLGARYDRECAVVFRRNGATWLKDGGMLRGTGSPHDTWPGASVALSADGNLAVVGGQTDDNMVGSTWSFARVNGLWLQKGEKIRDSSLTGQPRQGFSVSVSGDGRSIAVGACDNVIDRGASFYSDTNTYEAITRTLHSGWNIVSVPLTVLDYSRIILFPSAVTAAYSYDGAYATELNLRSGPGYWLKYSAEDTAYSFGLPRIADTIEISEGWNMIGSLSRPIPASGITSIPGGIELSNFYEYQGGYVVSPVIEPGAGYWVKASQAGQLILDVSSSNHSANRVRIVDSGESPPPPPGDAGGGGPKTFTLERNYPNPFNPITRIGYNLPLTAYVSLSVYTVIGQKVADLVQRVEEPGHKSVVFDGTGLPTGVYIYRISAGPFTETRRMILLQ